MSSAAETVSEAPKNYLNCETTAASWFNTRDHKRIGLMFLASVILFLFVGGLFALILRVELLTPERTIVSAQAYNRLFTLHGASSYFHMLSNQQAADNPGNGVRFESPVGIVRLLHQAGQSGAATVLWLIAVRPEQAVTYAADHPTFVAGALTIAAAALVLSGSVLAPTAARPGPTPGSPTATG